MTSLYSYIAARLPRGAHHQKTAKGLILVAAIAVAVTGCDQQPTKGTDRAAASQNDTQAGAADATPLGLAAKAQPTGGQNPSSQLPIIDLPEAMVCSGTNYRNGKGEHLGGKKTCSQDVCQASGATNCKVQGEFKAVKLELIDATKMHKAAKIASVSGSYDPDKYAKCTKTGQQNCSATDDHFAVHNSLVNPGTIKVGVVLSDLLKGQYPSAKYPMAPGQPTEDLTTGNVVKALSDKNTTYHFWTRNGLKQTITGDANLIPVNIIKDKFIYGVKGNTPAPTDTTCSKPGQKACVVTDSGNFVAINPKDMKAELIRKDVTIGGVKGTYPSTTNPLKGADGTAQLNLASNYDQLKTNANFGFFSAKGDWVIKRGDDSLRNPDNIKDGATIWGVAGNNTGVDYAGIDPRDIRKDVTIPTTSKKGGLNLTAHCSSKAECLGEGKVWQDVSKEVAGAANGCTAGSDKACVFRNHQLKYDWSFHPNRKPREWSPAAQYCKDLRLVFNEYGWRMPTQKEVMAAVSLGMLHLGLYTEDFYKGRTNADQRSFWTATVGTPEPGSSSTAKPDASKRVIWAQNYDNTFMSKKVDLKLEMICVRPVP